MGGRKRKVGQLNSVGLAWVGWLFSRLVNWMGKRVVASFTVQRQLVDGDSLPSSPNNPVHVSNGRAY